MSTTPITPFVNGQESSASAVMTALGTLITEGNTVIQNIVNLNNASLLNLQRRLNVLNGKAVRANDILPRNVLANFGVTDLMGIDQFQTTCELRADAGVATLSERIAYKSLVPDTVTFTSNLGNVQAIDTDFNLYQVYSTEGATPTGTFNIQLANPLELSILVFDLSSLSSSPQIQVLVSNAGVNFNEAISYSISGYNLIAYLTVQTVNYIKLILTPSQPDNLGGETYTFGLTDLNGLNSTFYLAGSLVTQAVTIFPTTVDYYLDAPVNPDITYYMGFNGVFTEISPNTNYPLPGIEETVVTGIVVDSGGIATPPSSMTQIVIDPTYIPNSLIITNATTGLPVNIMYGNNSDANLAYLIDPAFCAYVHYSNLVIRIIQNPSVDTTQTYNMSYLTQAATLQAALQLTMVSTSNLTSPTFSGATLVGVS
jgi:hypothetical protein